MVLDTRYHVHVFLNIRHLTEDYFESPPPQHYPTMFYLFIQIFNHFTFFLFTSMISDISASEYWKVLIGDVKMWKLDM